MISYWKTQWVNILLAVFDIVISIFHFCVGDQLWGVAWTLAAIVWFLMSFINYNEERIKLLEKKAEKYDALCEEVHALYEANKVDRRYTDHLNRKIDIFITDYQKKEKQK